MVNYDGRMDCDRVECCCSQRSESSGLHVQSGWFSPSSLGYAEGGRPATTRQSGDRLGGGAIRLALLDGTPGAEVVCKSSRSTPSEAPLPSDRLNLKVDF